MSFRLGPHQRLPVPRLTGFARRALETIGVPEDEATLFADILVEADCRGVHSHGVMRLAVYVARIEGGAMAAKTRLRVMSEAPGTVLLDGGNGPGHVACARAMDLAVAKAREAGVAVVAICNSNHNGTQAAYALRALPADMIGLCATLGGNVMAPWGGVMPLLGNNPFSLAAPTAEEPPVRPGHGLQRRSSWLDHAGGETRRADPRGLGHRCPGESDAGPQRRSSGHSPPHRGVQGLRPRHACGDPQRCPHWGRRGRGRLRGQSGRDEPDAGCGHMLVALDVARFMPVPEFKARMDQFIRDMRASERAPGVERIYVPGELEHAHAEEAARLGIPIDEAVLGELEGLSRRLGVPL